MRPRDRGMRPPDRGNRPYERDHRLSDDTSVAPANPATQQRTNPATLQPSKPPTSKIINRLRPVPMQQSRERPVGEQLAAGLAARAVVRLVLCVDDALDRSPTV